MIVQISNLFIDDLRRLAAIFTIRSAGIQPRYPSVILVTYGKLIPLTKSLFMNKLYRHLLSTVFLIMGIAANAQEKHFVDVAGLDPHTKPGDNFFRYVNGRWYDTAKIANDQSGVGSYSFMNIPQKKLLQNILDSVSKSKNTMGSVEQKVGDFYAAGMDIATINKRGYEPIKPILTRIDAITDVPSMMKFVAVEMRNGSRSIIGFGVSPDNKNSKINIAHLGQTGIGLPEREFY